MITCLMLLFTWLPAGAVEPDEMLDDPVMEARARDISTGLRCLVCRNESIDQSNAGLARTLRLLVRERLLVGDSNAQVVSYIVDRYGEYVLLKPQTGGSNLILWLAGPMMLLLGSGIALFYVRGRSRAGVAGPGDTLTSEEEARLRKILEE